MTWIEWTEILGNIGEFVGSFAVLATLVYLAVQVRHGKDLLEENRRISLSQVYQNRVEFRRDDFRIRFDSEFADIFHRLNAYRQPGEPFDFESSKITWASLTPVEQEKVRVQATLSLLSMDNTIRQAELGLLDDEMLRSVRNSVRSLYPWWRYIHAQVPWRVTAVFDELQAGEERPLP